MLNSTNAASYHNVVTDTFHPVADFVPDHQLSVDVHTSDMNSSHTGTSTGDYTSRLSMPVIRGGLNSNISDILEASGYGTETDIRVDDDYRYIICTSSSSSSCCSGCCSRVIVVVVSVARYVICNFMEDSEYCTEMDIGVDNDSGYSISGVTSNIGPPARTSFRTPLFFLLFFHAPSSSAIISCLLPLLSVLFFPLSFLPLKVSPLNAGKRSGGRAVSFPNEV